MFQTPQQPTARAHQLFQQGDFAGAIRTYRQILKARPNQPDILHRLAIAEAQVGEYDLAVRNLEKALRIRPRSPNFLADLGQMLIGARKYEDAERAYDRALEADPSFAYVYGAKAELYQLTGEMDKAQEAVERGLAAHPQDLRLALALAKLAPRLDDGERRAIALLESHLERGLSTAAAKMTLLFRLADQYDRIGDHDRAFELYTQANSLSPTRFSPERHTLVIDRMIDRWSEQAIAAAPRSSTRSQIPVFVLGMPRSGTSLVEQIIACHPRAHGGGELPEIPRICLALGGGMADGIEPMLTDPAVLRKPALEKHARAYLAHLHKLAPKASRITDKLPGNVPHIGLIDLMLPGARVIHCRRDPLDTCLSCFFQLFLGTFPWTYRLEWLGAYYRQYERLMEHWRTVLHDLPLLELPYEDLVSDQEAWTRRIIEFVGLEWDDDCLRFHESKRITATLSNEQVRRPIYKSSMQRHKKYEAHLGPLRQALGME